MFFVLVVNRGFVFLTSGMILKGIEEKNTLPSFAVNVNSPLGEIPPFF